MFRDSRLKKAISKVLVGLMIVVLCATMIPEQANAASVPEKLPNAAIYDKILSDRHFVIDTFTGNEFPEDNPHAFARGMSGEDYMYVDIMNDYNTTYSEDPRVDLLKAGVDIYYRVEHLGETALEKPSALLDMFATDESWTNFVNGAKNKSYESVIGGIFITDYTSPSGLSMASDMGTLQDLRTAYDYSTEIKELLGHGSGIVDALGDLNTEFKRTMVNEAMPAYSDDMYNYIAEIDEVLDLAHARSQKEAFDNLYEAKYYSMFTSEDTADKEWVAAMHEGQTLKNAGKVLEYLELGTSLINGTMEKALMLESLLQQRESMHGSLERTREEALAKGDNGFARVSKKYLELMEDENLSDANKQTLKATLLALSDEVQSKVDALAWKAVEAGIKKIITQVISCNGLSKEATAIFVGEKIAQFSDLIAAITFVGDQATGFGDVCERIYEIKYLQQMKEYVKTVYEEDEYNYKYAKRNGASADRLDTYAKKALDDLYLLKQLTLRANDLGYSICKGQADSWVGLIESWISNCNDAKDIENRYNAMQSILVDTTIDPITQIPITVGSGQTLKVLKNAQGDMTLVRESGSANDFVFGEPEYRLLGGIDIQGGTVVFSNNSDEEIFTGYINASSESGTIIIQSTAKIVSSYLATGWDASLSIEPETKATLDVTTIYNQGSLSLKNTTINTDNIKSIRDTIYKKTLSIAENCVVNIQQDMVLRDYGEISISDSTVSVGGNISANGMAYISSGLKINEGANVLVNGDVLITANGQAYRGWDNHYNINYYCGFYGGTLEVKGDLKDITDRSNPENTISAWDGGGSSFNLKMTGDRMQTIRTRDGLGRLEVTSPGIIAEGNLIMAELLTDLLVDSDVETLRITEPVEGKTIDISGSARVYGFGSSAPDLRLDKASKMTVGGDLTVESSMEVKGGSELITKGEFTHNVTSTYGNNGQVKISDGSSAEFRKNVNIRNYAEFLITNATMTVGEDLTADGEAYINSGLKINEGANVLVNGDVLITANGQAYRGGNNQYNINYYCGFYGGTLEVKGDLKDITDRSNPENQISAWDGGGSSFNLKMTGDRMQTIRTRDGLGRLEVTSPGIIAEDKLICSELLSDLNVYSCPDTISINDWNEHYVKLIGVDKFPSVTLPGGYGMKVSADGDLYNVTYASATGDTYTVNYIINNKTVKTVKGYVAGSLVIPYEAPADTAVPYEWYSDQEYTMAWNFKVDTIGGNLNLYGREDQAAINALREELTQLLAAAGEIEPNKYTEESVAVLEQAVTEAEAVLANEQATGEELIAARGSLKAAMEGLVKLALTITAQPEDVTVAAGERATFKVTAESDEGNELTYQWQWKSGSRDWANTSLAGYNTDTLSFTTTQAHNNRQYRCVVTDAAGNTAESEGARLTVAEPLAITAQPEDVTVAVGEKATFKITATGTGLKYQWQWKSGSRAWANTTMSGYNTDTLSFTAQDAHNNRQYRCVVTDANGNTVESDGAKLTIGAQPEPLSIVSQPEDVTVAAGEKATFKVTANGTGLKYQWQWKSGSRAWANTTLSGYNTNTLSFTAQDAHNNRQYRCVVTDASGNTVESDGAKLTISEQPEPLAIVTEPEDVTVAAGEKATFKITATGSGLKYQWQWKSGSRAWANTTLSGYNTDTLSFTAQDAHNNRQYRCVVTDANGNTVESEGAKLTIGAQPEPLSIVTQPEDVTVAVGEKATFKVTATGTGLKYQWQWKSGSRAWANTTLSGYNTDTLSFTAQDAHNGRQYRCVVTDANGNSVESDGAKLTIGAQHETLAIVTQPEDVTVKEGEKATFKITATGTGLKYQWQWKSGSRAWANTSMTGYNTDTLSFTVQTAHNNRQYRCVVTDADGNSVESEGAVLTVASTKKLDKATAARVTALKSIIDAVEARCDIEHPFVQWELDDELNDLAQKYAKGDLTEEELKSAMDGYAEVSGSKWTIASASEVEKIDKDFMSVLSKAAKKDLDEEWYLEINNSESRSFDTIRVGIGYMNGEVVVLIRY